MFKKIIAAAMFFLFSFGFISTGLIADDSSESDGVSLLRISIWPKKLYWPKKEKISGISIGLPSSCGLPRVKGVDFSFIWGDSQNVSGLKAAPVCTGSKLEGMQFAVVNKTDEINGGEVGIVNLADNSAGAQIGVYNKSENTKGGAQLGIVNFARKSKGIQLGIVNIMKNGFLPVFPFVNFPVK